jgi:hypothetical protein
MQAKSSPMAGSGLPPQTELAYPKIWCRCWHAATAPDGKKAVPDSGRAIGASGAITGLMNDNYNARPTTTRIPDPI